MLEEKKEIFKINKIVSFRISTGDELIGKIVSFNREFVTLNKPCSLMIQQDGIGLVPATMLGDPDKPVTYQRSSIVAHMEPNEKFLEVYEQHITTIELSKKEGLIVPK